jgi:hypothetical protein
MKEAGSNFGLFFDLRHILFLCSQSTMAEEFNFLIFYVHVT